MNRGKKGDQVLEMAGGTSGEKLKESGRWKVRYFCLGEN